MLAGLHAAQPPPIMEAEQLPLREYFQHFTTNLVRFRITDSHAQNMDELVVTSIKSLQPYRNEAVSVALTALQYLPGDQAYQTLHWFLEQITPYFCPSPDMHVLQRTQFDNFKWLAYELLLYFVAGMLSQEDFAGIAYLLGHDYLFAATMDGMPTRLEPFVELCQYLYSLDEYYRRPGSVSKSSAGQFVRDHVDRPDILFRDLMQADLVLYIRSYFEKLRGQRDARWFPATLLYAVNQGQALPLFVRAESREYLLRVGTAFAATSLEEWHTLVAAANGGQLQVQYGSEGDRAPVQYLINAGRLGQRP